MPGYRTNVVPRGAAAVVAVPTSLLGINFDANGGAALSASGFPIFQDRVREARGFTSSTNPWSAPVSIDASGWPTQDFLCLLVEGAVTPSWCTGTFKCGFTGTGTASAFGGCSINVTSTAGGKTDFDLTVGGGSPFGFEVTSTSGTITNVFAYLPGYGASTISGGRYQYSSASLFTADALLHYAKYAYIRAMDWSNALFNTTSMTGTNRNTASNTKSNKAGATSNTADGYPCSWMVDFVNQCGNGIWYNTAITYNSAYLTSLANDLLSVTAGEPIYIEAGNELWNFVGIGGSYSSVVSAYKTANPGVIDYDSTTDQALLAARYLVIWLHDIATAFSAVFGSRYGTDLKIVCAWQTGGNGMYVLNETVKFSIRQYGSVIFHALAVAPYKTRNNSQVPGDGVNHTAVNDTIANIQSQLSANANYIAYLSNLENLSVLAQHNGLQMLSYEGGWEIGGEGGTPANLGAAIMDSGMTAVVNGYLNNQLSSGLNSFCWLAAGMETSTSNQSPGYKLTNDYSQRDICPRVAGFANLFAGTPTYNRNVVSGSGSSFSGKNCADFGWNGSSLQFLSSNPTLAGAASNFLPFLGTGGYVPYIVDCTAPGTYSLVVNFTGSGSTDLWSAGTKISTAVSIQSGTNNVTVGNVTLKRGVNYVLLGNGTNQGGVTINTLTFN